MMQEALTSFAFYDQYWTNMAQEQ